MPSLLAAQDYGWVDEARTQHHDAALRPRQSQRLSIKDPQPAEQAAQQAPTVDDAEQPGAQSATSVDQAAQPQAQSAAPRTTAEQTDFWKLLGAQNKDDLEGILSVCEVRLVKAACCSQVTVLELGLMASRHADGLCTCRALIFRLCKQPWHCERQPEQRSVCLRRYGSCRHGALHRIRDEACLHSLLLQSRASQARDRRVSSLVEALSLHSNDVRDDDPSACEAPSLDARSSAAAVWSLAVFGGPLLFEADMDVLLEVLLSFQSAYATTGDIEHELHKFRYSSYRACTGHYI